ncbi:MAG: type II toxin-antitoxin system RelE/ParE family toxin [Cyclobacteriaceae bacterium]
MKLSVRTKSNALSGYCKEKRALKALEDINEPYYSNIKEAIYALADNPRLHGCKRLKGRDGYRIRVADYRILYDIFDSILLVELNTKVFLGLN